MYVTSSLVRLKKTSSLGCRALNLLPANIFPFSGGPSRSRTQTYGTNHLSICISLFCSIFRPLPIQRLAIPLLPHIVRQRQLHRPTGPPCTRTSQPSYSPSSVSSPAPVRSVRGLDVVLRLGAPAAALPSVIPNMVSKTRGIGRQLFVERLTVPGPPGLWPRFCCLTWAAHDMFQHFLDPACIKWPLGLPT